MRSNHIVAALAVVACLTTSQAQAVDLCVAVYTGGNCDGKASCPLIGTVTEAECLTQCFSGSPSCSLADGCIAEDCLYNSTEIFPPLPVPTVSEWGMASLVLVLLTGLGIKFGAMKLSRKAE